MESDPLSTYFRELPSFVTSTSLVTVTLFGRFVWQSFHLISGMKRDQSQFQNGDGGSVGFVVIVAVPGDRSCVIAAIQLHSHFPLS